MAVLDSVPNALNTCTSGRPYGCSNKVRQDGYYLQVREYSENGEYELINKYIPNVMSKECRFDHSLIDQRCQFCDKRGSGERYDAMIRRLGT